MKKLILITALFITAAFLNANAQYTKLLDFDGATNGKNPIGALYSDGTFLYGMTYIGGTYNAGTIFKILKDGTGYSKLLDFDGPNGAGAFGSLISDGTFLYGMTAGGGSHNQGTIFKIMKDGTGYSKLFDFHSTTSISGSPHGSLVFDGVYLYGITHEGGINEKGAIFKIMTDGTGFSKIFDFDGANGNPGWSGTLILQGGYLYGMTWSGGTNDMGVIFKVLTDGTGYVKLLDFDGANGSNPIFSCLYYDGVFLYGGTYNGGIAPNATNAGVLFKIMPDGTGYSKLIDFDGGPCSGAHPYGYPLISDGTFLYGTTLSSGSNGQGVLFKIMPDGTGYHQMLNFAGTSNGSQPQGGLISDGTFLYGMTAEGGIHNMGTIFKLQMSTGTAVPNTWYADADGDGYGTGAAIINCIQPPNTSAINGDCNDANAGINPGSTEICGNTTDDNCNGVINEGCCAITVNAGNDESTFFGYSGDQTVTRTATVSGGTAPFTYSWTLGRPLKCNSVTSAGDEIFSGGTCVNTVCPTTGTLTNDASCSGSATVTVRLMDTSNVCVTVTDANGCVATDCFTVMAQDARCFAGNSNNAKVKVCHHTSSATNPWVQICIADNAVAAHLANNSGDYVGTCGSRLADGSYSGTGILVYPNPAQDQVTIEFESSSSVTYQLAFLDVTGRVVMNNNGGALTGNNKVELPLNGIAPGVYNIRLTVGDESNVVRLIITEKN